MSNESIITAFHEAGHVVMRASLGLRTVNMAIYDDIEAGPSGKVIGVEAIWPAHIETQGRIDYSMGGPVAESMFTNETWMLPREIDIKVGIEELIQNGYISDEFDRCAQDDLSTALSCAYSRHKNAWSVERYQREVKESLRRCHSMLSQRWSIVSELAHAVLNDPKNSLPIEEIERICPPKAGFRK